MDNQQIKRAEKSFDNWAKAYDSGILLPIFFKRVQRRILDYLGDIGEKRVLDIGCGTGNFLLELYQRNPNGRYYGIDLSTMMISIARDKSRGTGLDFWVGEAEKTGFESGSFDYITSMFSFHHWGNQEKSLENLHRLLNEGGELIITDINFFGGRGTNKIVRARKMKKMLLNAGFSEVHQLSSTTTGKYGFLSAAIGAGIAGYNVMQMPETNMGRTIAATVLIAGGIIYSIPNWMSKISIAKK